MERATTKYDHYILFLITIIEYTIQYLEVINQGIIKAIMCDLCTFQVHDTRDLITHW